MFDLWNTLVRSQQGDPFQHLQRLLGPGQEAGFAEFKRDAMSTVHPDAETLLRGWQARLGLDEAQVRAMVEVFREATEDAECFPDALAAVTETRRLGLFPGELAMVGDSWRDDITGALEAGWTALWVNRAGKPRPDWDPEALLVEVPELSRVPEAIANLQAGARCGTCLG